MDKQEVLKQLKSLADNSESFYTKDGDDEIWRKDVMALGIAMAVITMFDEKLISQISFELKM